LDRKRVYEAAKELKISSEALLKILRGMGLEVKSPMSMVGAEALAEVTKKFEEEKAALKREYQEKKKRREKREAQRKPLPKRPTTTRKKVPEAVRIQPPAPAQPQPQAPPQARPQAPPQPAPPRREEKKVAQARAPEPPRAVRETVRKTLISMEKGAARPRYRRRAAVLPGEEAAAKTVRINAFATAGELAQAMGLKPSEIISKCLELGLIVTINQRLDMDTIEAVADEFGFQVSEVAEFEPEYAAVEQRLELLEPRPPVVTVMGHVDHGKTSLLDAIRKTDVVAGEKGGITQHIGAYGVKIGRGSVTFLDTPGHEAFTAMRARGAQVTDLVVLVVGADEGVMPQTVEALDHARAAAVPVIVAINKCDLPNANPMRVKQQLSQHGVTFEEWGGKTIALEVSARTRTGVDRLLEMILLQAEIMELKADVLRPARGAVIEARLDRGRGPVATLLVQEGILRAGVPLVVGQTHGKVRAMYNDRGEAVPSASPSQAVLVQGLSAVPQAGDTFQVTPDEREAREICYRRQQLRREAEFRPLHRLSLEEFYKEVQAGRVKDLPLIVKGDVDGSVEVLSDALYKLGSDRVRVKVVHKGVGAINESDVLLAASSNAIVIGFHVRADERAAELARNERVETRFYEVIYELLDDVRKAMEGLLEPEYRESVSGRVEVREVFRVPDIGIIAGSYVLSGSVARGARVRVLRDSVVVYTGRIGSLRRFKEDVRDVQNGFECGIKVENFEDIKKGDLLETFTLEEIRPSL
jgi:translation initiation factor IF-2